jgi:hypothetical protein
MFTMQFGSRINNDPQNSLTNSAKEFGETRDYVFAFRARPCCNKNNYES